MGLQCIPCLRHYPALKQKTAVWEGRAKMPEKYDFKKIEKEMLDFWEKHKIHEKANLRNRGKKHFYFLDGPPYTSGRVHIGTAWNKALKDIALRYKRMRGFDVWDRAGYDMHGMPTELAVQRELKLRSKDEIEKYGIEKFVTKCMEFSVKNMHLMNSDFKRLGVWMDFENAYQPVSKEYIEGEWWLIKKAHENQRLYEGKKTMTWCAECATSLAKHELEYRNVSDDSIFLKFRVVGTENEFLVIWTTTPWTIPFNLGVMVHPGLEYVKAKVGNEVWVVAKALAGVFISGLLGRRLEILEEFRGEKLKGIKYEHPLRGELKELYDRLEKQSEKVHTVVMSEEYVNTSAGSGLVHMAPGCGPEDYEVGYREGIPPFNELGHDGVFRDSMAGYAGWRAKKDDKRFIEEFRKKGCLITSTKIEHDYAHCWRCKEPVVYRTTTQWFFRVEDLKENMRELNKGFHWVPDFAGAKNFDSWLANLRDNGITRQRYWGTPLPVWKCRECGEYVVIGSLKELEEKTGAVPEDLHKPWIDAVTMNCECGSVMKRIPDILDVWVDSGTASWNCLNFPQDDTLFKKMFPADFILEGYDQIRGWFNLLFVASMVSMGKPSFKSVYMHGFVQDATGRKMSKSLGNYILPEEVIEKYGADTFRYYSTGAASPGIDLNYNLDDMQIKYRNLGVVWNLHNFIIELSRETGKNPAELKPGKNALGTEEKYIISKCNSAVMHLTAALDGYRLNEAEKGAESLFMELSRIYIQFVREKAAAGTDKEKETVLAVAYDVYMSALRMFAVVCPFITEKIYQNFRKEFGPGRESIHMEGWPDYDRKLINPELEKDMDTALGFIQSVLFCREKAQLGVRWPVREVVFVCGDDKACGSIRRMEEIIKRHTNIKSLSINADTPDIKTVVKPNHERIGQDYGKLVPKIIARFVSLSFGDILRKIDTEGKYIMEIDGRDIEIARHHLLIERELPENFFEAEFSSGYVILDASRDDELDSEGFAREVMRRIQALRKKSGLTKKDTIELSIECSERLSLYLKSWAMQIKEKVGARKLDISAEKAESWHEFASDEKVKDEKLRISFRR